MKPPGQDVHLHFCHLLIRMRLLHWPSAACKQFWSGRAQHHAACGAQRVEEQEACPSLVCEAMEGAQDFTEFYNETSCFEAKFQTCA